ncbi:MAG: ABC transporter permease [Phycisphaerales bacterium]|nr:ABC transporter permease [Phycisphaerales bacterium]
MSHDQRAAEQTISGIDVMRGVGAAEAKSFWADAWSRVVSRRGAQFGLLWIGVIGFFAIFAPVLANGLPLWTRDIENGQVVRAYSPLFESLTATDILLLLGGVIAPVFLLIPMAMDRQRRLGLVCGAALLGGVTVVMVSFMQYLLVGEAPTGFYASAAFPWILSLGCGLVVAAGVFWMPTFSSMSARIAFAVLVSLVSGVVIADRWSTPVANPEQFLRGQADGTMENTYTLVPWSPTQARAAFYSRHPVTSVADGYREVSEDQLNDGIAFYIRTVAFNLAPAPGLPMNREVEGAIVDMLNDKGNSQEEGTANLSEAGLSRGGIDQFKLLELGLSEAKIAQFQSIQKAIWEYDKAIREGKPDEAETAASTLRFLVDGLEPSSRNARIMIADAGEELTDSIQDRINYVNNANAIGETSYGRRDFLLGTDPIGRDVLTQMLHACRLSISIGLVSTGLSVLIGIIIGSIMGYFGGWVDLVLSRFVEIFMAIPVLFLLIVAASVLPRNTYVMMAIIGCVTWTGSARFIRAEFLKLRNQDFVQSCRAVGLPLHSTLFRHMLPNGVTPVLVQASFGVAAAIIAEATLSYLGLGPYGQSSWGKLLSLTTGETGIFLWWMAVFPGVAIFLTVLAYNVLGENLRDAIDPKMRKAAH